MTDKIKKNKPGFYEVVKKPTQQELKEYYSDKYYQLAKGSYEHEYSSDECFFNKAKIQQYFANIIRLKPTLANGGELLDVGCGEGYTLSYFLDKNWSVRGIDFSSSGIESKNPHCKEFFIEGDIFQLLSQEIANKKKYNVIWLSNVLEHVIDPIGLLKSLREIVAEDGVLVVNVPNDFSSIQIEAINNRFINYDFWVALPDHLSYFNSDSLKKIGAYNNWKCLDILGSFPVDWYLYHKGSNYINNKNAGKPAHMARVKIENIIHKQSVENALQLWRSFAQVGMGRDLIAFFSPKNS